ncbi:RNA exonuclease 3 [Magnaporthiopsis poae ATCC 64411]|uniref:RNA exonuclease 3 n=1 Tax=Magnaporthiopsis poae (strain ATCC 64411 / 73-15) TaxID=644358 RepID=A0A0C4DSM3_MAGP6|nr:RNA exonuclease 3 [Magnaporthiopsis poae ATCC 64411]
MDTQLQIFKHIDCPAGRKCTSVRCLFRHADEGETRDSDSADSSSQEGPDRKRLKSGAEEYDPTAPPVLLPDLAAADDECAEDPTPGPGPSVIRPQPNNHVPAATSTTSLATNAPQRAAISPPPLKRKRPDVSPGSTSSPARGEDMAATRVSKAPQDAPTTTSSSSSSSSSDKAPSAKQEETLLPPVVRKPETLNPRPLKSNPARFEVRYRLIKMLHDEYSRLNKELQKLAKDDDSKKLILSDQEIIWMALDEEESAAARESVYSSVLKSRIMSCKKLSVEKWREERRQAIKAAEAALSGGDKGPASSSQPVVIETGLTAVQEVVLATTKLLTPIGDLAKFGYVPTVPSEEDVAKAKEAEAVAKGWEICDRCTKRFQVFPGRREEDGALASGGTCTHHPGKPYIPNRQTTDRSVPEKQYRCCGETVGQSAGCTTKDNHVFRTSDPKRMACLWNFVETPENANAPLGRAVCFDCEMGYTVKGFELIRLTATSWPGGEELVDVLVRPFGEILDLNSAYSGVYPEDIGHDSAEDARAAGDLVRWKVKGVWEKMKREGWKVDGERLVPPGKA